LSTLSSRVVAVVELLAAAVAQVVSVLEQGYL
jgi:hypothetical protein